MSFSMTPMTPIAGAGRKDAERRASDLRRLSERRRSSIDPSKLVRMDKCVLFSIGQAYSAGSRL